VNAIEATSVERRYRNRRGVGPVSLEVLPGERVAIMGSNGAGKTTLLRMLATASPPARGSITWNGIHSARAARRLLGYAPDDVIDTGALSGRQSAHFWCSQWMRGAAVRRNVNAALYAFSLDAVADEPLESYSFGMRRRLLLVQALAHDPDIALLDEPSAGLDGEGREAVAAAMRERAGRGRTTVIATNDTLLATGGADRVVFLHGGHVIRDATPQQLLAETRLQRCAELEIVGEPDLRLLGQVRGVGSVVRHNGTVSVELRDRASLAPLVAAADASGGKLRGLTVREPDLNDSFRILTGVDLVEPEE
jgi:ABC-type multidrug transport system ATPase subunit